MKFDIDRDELATALKVVCSIASNSPISPVLALTKVTLLEDSVQFVATDLLLVAWASAPCAVKEADSTSVLIDPSVLLKYVKSLPDGVLTVESDKDTLVLSSGKSRSALAVADAASYVSLPPLDTISETDWVSVPKGQFFSDFDAVRTVVSAVTDAPQFCQAAVRENIWLGYDGKRVHAKPCQGYSLPEFSIPYYGIKPLRALLAKQDYDTFDMALADLAVVYRTPRLTLLVYNLKADFAEVGSMLKQTALSQPHAVDVDRDDMLSALSRVMHTMDSSGAVKLSITADQITMSTESTVGTSSSTLLCSGSVEQDVYVRVWHIYEAFKALPSASGIMYLGDHANVSGAKEVSPVRLLTPPGVEKFTAVFSQLKKDVL